MQTLGIDEAGRGALIGPLVMAGAMMDESTREKLQQLGVQDSKLLTAKKREELYPVIQQHTTHSIISVPPAEVDEALRSDDSNLNLLEAIKSIEIINTIKPERVIIDAPSSNLRTYKRYITERVSVSSAQVLVEHKADLNHIQCAAASVLAKVTRDRAIKEIKQSIGKDFGSGYPSDPRTQAFLEAEIDEYPDIFRKTWQPYKKVLSKKKQKTLEVNHDS